MFIHSRCFDSAPGQNLNYERCFNFFLWWVTRHAYLFKCRYDSIELEATLLVIPLLLEPARSQREQSIGS